MTDKKERKPLFKHNEKTDFIKNMTSEGLQKLTAVFLITSVIGLFIFDLPYYLFKGVIQYTDEYGFRHSWDSTLIYLQAIAILLFGFFLYLPFLIAALKKRI